MKKQVMMRLLSLAIAFLFTLTLSAQKADSIPQKDLIDIVKSLWKSKAHKQNDTLAPKVHNINVSVAPVLGYSLSTGAAAVMATNVAFYLGDKTQTNMSAISANVIYTQYNQVNIPLETNIWTKNNGYNITADWRLMLYPLQTYGLGTKTKDTDAALLNFTYVRFYQSILKNLGKDWYTGVGYNLDYYTKTTIGTLPENRIPEAVTYGIKPTSISSGATLNLLYNSRKNPNNPQGGEQYANVVFRHNSTLLKSDNAWQSLLIDLRKYVNIGNGRNILAFWSYNAFTLAGQPPYQVLSSTGWDTYNNTGRGYVQGRFRGKNMMYLESEYRFTLTRNGLLGGVLFANGESFSEPTTNRFQAVAFGYGLGLRVKLNKLSNANIAIDYGFGANGSRGFFVNLGEVF